MPSFNHIVKTPYNKSFRSTKVEGQFDLKPESVLRKEWQVDLPVEDFDWNIGVIVGPSGAGKTSIGSVAFGQDAFHKGYEDWPHDSSVLDAFPEQASTEDITKVLSSVGFSSPPNWLQPYHTLSNGQKFRVEMARLLFDERETIVVDEFTSVVDRNVAKIGSCAFAKTARRRNKQMVLLSCHYDILEWLEPDWVYYVDQAKFTKERLRRPKINIEIKRCHHSAWRIFREHHYLSQGLLTQSDCYVALANGEPAGFFAYVKETMSKRKNVMRGHRSVVMPDYQGVGIGAIATKAIMRYYTEKGFIVKAITSHPAFIAARSRDPDFRLCNKVDYDIKHGVTAIDKDALKGLDRITATFQYVGNRKNLLLRRKK